MHVQIDQLSIWMRKRERERAHACIPVLRGVSGSVHTNGGVITPRDCEGVDFSGCQGSRSMQRK